MANFLERVFGDPAQRRLKQLESALAEINSFEPQLEQLSDSELAQRATALRQQIQQKLGYDGAPPEPTEQTTKREQAVLNSHRAEAFALVREAAKRTLHQRHFDEQLLAGLALHEGMIAEQKTGEGKTLAATLPIFLNALVGRGAHVVTVNDYLARRDAGWMGQIYDFLGLSVGCIVHDLSFLFSREAEEDAGDGNNPTLNLRPAERGEAYRADVTYGTNNEFGFDYLRDNMAPAPKFLRQRPLYYCIVDEVDSILIDEARTPLIISAPAEESGDRYDQFAGLVRRLATDDYIVDEKERAVRITDSGVTKIQQWLGLDNLYEGDNTLLVHHLDEALKAEYLFARDKDYVIKDGEVIIVDEFTGRLMPGRRYSEGLHQAIEAKESVHVQRESDTLATISFQNFFRLYAKLAGMTGTAKTEEEEFIKLYNTEVAVIPTHREVVRHDHADKIYLDEAAKFAAIIEDVKTRQRQGQPVLLGTISVAKNELLSKLLTKAGVAHQVLNAKNHEREAGIVAEAGAPGSVTLATNMAGRGTDIVLGGAPPLEADRQHFADWEKRRAAVLEAGGLCVIGSERHESRRIDNQLRGRSGRQGEPGESIFYVSMDDDLMRIFAGDRLKSWMQRANLPADIPIQNSLVSRSIEQAQKRVEGHNFDIRKHVVQYDDVMNKHRQTLYAKRWVVMNALGPDGTDPEAPGAAALQKLVREMIQNAAGSVAQGYLSGSPETWSLEELVGELSRLAPLTSDEQEKLKTALTKIEEPAAAQKIISQGFLSRYTKKEHEHTAAQQRLLERAVLLRSIDSLWVEHLNVMSDLRQGVGLQAVAQQDPLVVYQQKGYQQFLLLTRTIEQEATRQLLHLTRMTEEEAANRAAAAGQGPRRLILHGASEADAGGAVRLAELGDTVDAGADAAAPNADGVTVTVRRAAERLAEAGARGASPSKNLSVRGDGSKVGRNDPCPCGSGKKYKKCHGR